MTDNLSTESSSMSEHNDRQPSGIAALHSLFLAPVTKSVEPGKPGSPYFELAEHNYLGDNILLTTPQGLRVDAGARSFELSSGVKLTYGQINALAGDFYGTWNPISDGINPADRLGRFWAAWRMLGENKTLQPSEAQVLLKIHKDEIDKLNIAISQGQDPSEMYAGLSGSTFRLEIETMLRRRRSYPSYLALSRINWDHFGDDARAAYSTGHTAAIDYAREKESSWDVAYAMNAFADHYLQDLFSAGHLRTPRRNLHGTAGIADLCAKYMHDEECAIGLSVKNERNDSWQVYGDKRLLDNVNKRNLGICRAAIQQSADEVYKAWKDKTNIVKFEALDYVPTKISIDGNQELVPLFQLKHVDNKDQLWRRLDLADRRNGSLGPGWGPKRTVIACYKSGLWKPPIQLDR